MSLYYSMLNSIEQGKTLLAKLDDTAKKGEDALKALVAGHGERS
jgi:hypothetical protein